jgi:Fur family ferric uptake transcriptional regulator
MDMDMHRTSIEEMKKILKNRGYRLTTQRNGILEILYQNREKHLTVKEIHKLTKGSMPKMSVATVYKTMLQLEKAGLLYRISIYGYCSRYQLILPGNENRHRHLVCTRCGKIQDIDPKEFSEVEQRLESRYGISIESQNLLYYEICKECVSFKNAK